MATQKPLSDYTDDELLQVISGQPPAPQQSSGIIRRTVGDLGVGLAQSAVTIGEQAAGLAQLMPVVGVAARKAIEYSGYDPEATRQVIGEYFSPERKAKLAPVDAAKGPVETFKALADTPSNIPFYVAQSAFPMLATIGTGGAAYAGAIRKGATTAAALAKAGRAASAAEGVFTAGGVSESIRQGGGTLAEQYYGVPAGIATAAISNLTGKLTGGPLEAILARRAAGIGLPTARVGRATSAVLGGGVEAIEEAGQSASEQAFTNLGTGRPIGEGVGKAAVLGAAVGAPMGAVLGGLSPQSVSINASTGKPIDPLGDQRETFTKELEAIKETYFKDIADGVPEPQARALYQSAAKVLKDNLIAGLTVPDAVTTTPPTEAVQQGEAAMLGQELIPEDIAEQDVYPPAAPVLEAMPENTGAALAEHIVNTAADPEARLATRNAVLIALTEAEADPAYVKIVTDILDNPDTAMANAPELDAAVRAMQETTDKFYESVAAAVEQNNPEIINQLFPTEGAQNAVQEQEAAAIPVLAGTEAGQGMGRQVRGTEGLAGAGEAQVQAQGQAAGKIKAKGKKQQVTMTGDAVTQAKFEKGRAMRAAAEKRQATGQLTAKEQAAVAKREAGNYKGKAVLVDGKPATVVSTPFGKVRVKFEDGTLKSVEPAAVSAAPKKVEPTKAAASPAVDKAAKAAADSLDVTKLLAVPKEARASLGRKLSDAVARAILGEPTQVMRNAKGEESKAGTVFVRRVHDAANRIVELSRRLDRLSAKVSPRVTESLVNVQKLKDEANIILADIAAKPANPDAVLERYKALRKSMESVRGGKLPDPAAEAFRAKLLSLRDDMPKRSAKNVLRISDVRPSVQAIADFLNTNPDTGKYITGMVFQEADGTKLSELNDTLAKEIDVLLQLLGGRKNDAKSMAVARANLDKIIGTYKSAKFSAAQAEYDRAQTLMDEAVYEDEFGAYDEEAADIEAKLKEREKYDIMLSMAWAAYKDGRVSRLANRATGRATGPLSAVSDRIIRDALETGVGTDASKSPIAAAYENGFVYDKNDPAKATPPGTRAVLSFLGQSATTPMTRTLANMLKEVLAARIPSKTNPNPANPVRMMFLTPEQASSYGVQSARWIPAQALAELRKSNPSLPADGELVMVATASPEAILHELFHATTANWVRSVPTQGQILKLKGEAREAARAKRETVDRLYKQLEIAIVEANRLAKGGVPDGSKLSSVIQTLQAIDAAGKKPGLTENAAKANRVAEFISYAMTRAPFQEFLAGIHPEADALATIEYTPAEQSLLDKLGNLFKSFLETIRVMLGLKAESASTPARFERNRRFMTYLVNRIILINKAGMAEGLGTVVQADSLDHTAAMNLTADQVIAARKSLPKQHMNVFDRITSKPFRLLGAALGTDYGTAVKNAEAAAGAKFEAFMKAHPNFAVVAGQFIEYVGVNKDAIAAFKDYSQVRGAANRTGNLAEDLLRRMPMDKQVQFMEALLDPAKRDKLPPHELNVLLDVERTIKNLQTYGNELDAIDPRLKNASIAELIQYSVDKSEIASKNFSAAPVAFGAQKIVKSVEKANVVLHVDSQASSPFDGAYYPVYTQQDGTVPQMFIASSNPAMLAHMKADTTVPWRFEKVKKNGDYEFVRNKTYAEIRAMYPKMPVANFLANTLAVMSKAVASRQFVAQMLDINENATDADKILFDSKEELTALGVPESSIFEWVNEGRKYTALQQAAARKPDSWVMLSGERYGDLNGKYVNGSVFSAMQDMHSSQPFINSPKYNALLRFWKATKTRWSFATHMTNTISNVSLAYMHDIPMSTVLKAANIYKKVMRKQPLTAAERAIYDDFTASGAVLGNYSANELMRKQVEALTEMREDGVSETGTIWDTTKRFMGYEADKATLVTKMFDAIEKGAGTVAEKADKLNELTASLYENEDNVFRMAAFLTERERLQAQGITDKAEIQKKAGAYAKYVMVDYEINAKGINMLRQTAMPFLAWTYRAVPMMVRIGYTKPWKIINLLTAISAVNALAYASLGDDADEEEERRMLDKHMQQRIWGIGPPSYIRQPFGGKDNPVFYGVGKYFPTGDFIGASDSPPFGVPYWPSALAPTGPVVALLSAAMGYDNFEGRTLWNDANTWNQNAKESLLYLVREMSPATPLEPFKALLDDKKGLVGNDINHMYALTRYFGPRIYQVNASEQQYKRAKDLQADVQAHKALMRKVLRAEARLGNPNWEKAQAEVRDITQRLYDKVAETRGEE